MKNKKVIITISCITVIIILVVAAFVLKSTSPSVVGEWVIESYNTANGNIKQENIGEYYGENYQNANAIFSALFKSDGTVILNMSVYEGMEPVSKEVSYEIKCNVIFCLLKARA